MSHQALSPRRLLLGCLLCALMGVPTAAQPPEPSLEIVQSAPVTPKFGDLSADRRQRHAKHLSWGALSALKNGDLKSADQVLQLALPNLHDPKILGRLALGYANAGRPRTAEALLRRGGRIDDQEILNRVGAGDLDFILWLIDLGYDARGIAAMAYRWNTELLHELAIHDMPPEEAQAVSPERPKERALAYLRAGADPCLNKIWQAETASPTSESPSPQILGRCLRVALEDGRAELARLLLDAGADAAVGEERNPERGYTTLQLAAELGDLGLMRELRRAGSPETFHPKSEAPSRKFWKQFGWVGYGPEEQMNHDLGGHTLRVPALFESRCEKQADVEVDAEWDIECVSEEGLAVRAKVHESPAAYVQVRLEKSLGIDRGHRRIIEDAGEELEPEGWVRTVSGLCSQLAVTLQVEGHRLNAPEIDQIAESMFYDVKPAPLEPYVTPGNLALFLLLGFTAFVSLILLLLNKTRNEQEIQKPDVWA